MRRRTEVALLIETSNSYARGLMRGIKSYIREHRPWSIYMGEHGRGDAAPSWLSGWDGQGIIARIENRRMAQAVMRCNKPAVDVSAGRLVPSLPYIETDDVAIARMAADHLMERGFRHFAYCGVESFDWSKYRRMAFSAYLREAGHVSHVYQPPGANLSWQQEQAALAKWLRSLPKPVGVMACYDIRGQQLLEACRRLELPVPDEVAVIGVDNDELLCDLSDPPLTSIIPDTHRTGYEAAAILDRMMAGKPVTNKPVLVPPKGIVTRRSTDVLATTDRFVSEAVRFIREHACDGINVEHVLEAVPLSRRALESRFRRIIGRTPHEQIVQLRVDRVKELLGETDLPLMTISERAGFKHVEYMSVVFKKKTGRSPSEYRGLMRR